MVTEPVRDESVRCTDSMQKQQMESLRRVGSDPVFML